MPTTGENKSKKAYVEGVNYPKVRIGDKVKVKIKDKRNMEDGPFGYMVSRPWFEVKGIQTVNPITGDDLPFPCLDIGYRHHGIQKESFYYPILRFQLVEDGDIDFSDPYGEEKWEVTTTFDNHVSTMERKAGDFIGNNIASLWIDKAKFDKIVKVVGIQEDDDTFKYIIKYSIFKVKTKHNVNSAVLFTRNFQLLSEDSIVALEKQITNAEKVYKDEIQYHNDTYKQAIRKSEETLKRSTNKSDKLFKTTIERINAAIALCKK